MKHLPLLLLLTFIIGGCASSRRLSENVHQQDSVDVRLKPVLNTYPILSLLRYRHKRQNVKQPIVHRILKTITQLLTLG